ncbi:MAG: hypothetical protein RLY86_4257 [Pseudomonadota bacterium]|jgi:hypothetical protein
MRRDAGDLARGLAERAGEFCRCYLPRGRCSGAWWSVGDVSGAPGRSLYIRLTGPSAGQWCDAATGEHGDLLDLLRLSRGLSFNEACREARAWLTLSAAPLPRGPSRDKGPTAAGRQDGSPAGRGHDGEGEEPSLCLARRLWSGARPLAGSVAARYLAGRGLCVSPGDAAVLRCHPRCRTPRETGQGPGAVRIAPALIAAVTDATGRLTGVHRTWLRPDGSGHAVLIRPRRALGHLLGHGVRFGEAGPLLVVGEGIETLLALRLALPGLPAIAALSAGHLGAVLLPPDLRRLYVAVEPDPAGQAALARLQARAQAAGLPLLPLPARQGDANDDLRAYGLDGLRAHLSAHLHDDDRDRCLSPPSAWAG